MKPKLIIAVQHTDDVIARAQKEFDLIYDGQSSMTVKRLLDQANAHDPLAIMVTVGHKLDAAAISKLPSSVKIIATSSVGYDNVDVEAANARGIAVTNTPDVLTDATADIAMLLMLGACRRMPDYTRVMATGWGKSFGSGDLLGIDLAGKRLGILGMGRIGRAVAQRARAFGMEILYSNRKRLPPELELGAKYFANLREMLPRSQVFSVNAPGTVETENIMNKETIGLLPRGAVLINVARGSMIDEDALIEALKSRHLFAAGLDVFKNEPHIDRRLLDIENLFMTPHMGSATRETRNAMGYRALDNIASVLKGEKPRDLVQ